MTDLKKIRIQTHEDKTCEPRLGRPNVTSISRFEQSNSPSGSLTTRCPAAQCLNSQTLPENSLPSVSTQMLNNGTGDTVRDCRDRRFYRRTDEKIRPSACIRHDSERSALQCIKYKYSLAFIGSNEFVLDQDPCIVDG
jgi:hypothetical protein